MINSTLCMVFLTIYLGSWLLYMMLMKIYGGHYIHNLQQLEVLWTMFWRAKIEIQISCVIAITSDKLRTFDGLDA